MTDRCPETGTALRIGVVGHRTNLLSRQDMYRLKDPVQLVLDSLCQTHTERFDSDAWAQLHILCSLAEGADRIFAREAIRRNIPLTAVLPFPRDRFEMDFEDFDSRREYRKLLDTAVEAIEPPLTVNDEFDGYAFASDLVVHCCDMLVAIWDGLPGRGAGGTAESIEKATIRQIPVVWILADEPYGVEVLTPNPSDGLSARFAGLVALQERLSATENGSSPVMRVNGASIVSKAHVQ